MKKRPATKAAPARKHIDLYTRARILKALQLYGKVDDESPEAEAIITLYASGRRFDAQKAANKLRTQIVRRDLARLETTQ